MTAEILVVRRNEAARLIELPLVKKKGAWEGTFAVADANALLLLYRFAAGDKIDDRGGKSWDALIHASGTPVKGSHLQLANIIRARDTYGFKVDRPSYDSRLELQQELALYPDHAAANSLLWRLQLRDKPGDSTKAAIAAALQKVYAANSEDEEAVSALLGWFDQTGQPDQARAIRAEWMRKNPLGLLARSALENRLFQNRDPQQRILQIDSLLTGYDLTAEWRAALESFKINTCILNDQIEMAVNLLDQMKEPQATLYNDLAWKLLQRGDQTDLALDLARRGVERLRQQGPGSKASYEPTREWAKSRDMSLGNALGTYGLALARKGRMLEAEEAYQEAWVKSSGEIAEISNRLFESLLKNGKAAEALEKAGISLSRGKGDEQTPGLYRTAWTRVKGSAAGVEEELARLQAAADQAAREHLLASRLHKPAPDFALPSLDGRTIKLSEQKGRVVVVDFWATWCGPCIQSFPSLQKVHEKYQSNPDVLILALNTWERDAGAQREERVRKFISDNKYTFTVLLDVPTVEKYGVTSIPTKFVIDKKGEIAFESIGFDGGEAMMRELSLEIDLLLAE